ncbi:hypothetical protein Droror1_Dr00012194 [Drosera rotundifolia]
MRGNSIELYKSGYRLCYYGRSFKCFCADAREQYKRGVCFNFLNRGRCDRGPDCQFEHKLLDESSKMRRPEGGSINRPKECWFCLSSPNVEADLIVSIGERLYCALIVKGSFQAASCSCSKGHLIEKGKVPHVPTAELES